MPIQTDEQEAAAKRGPSRRLGFGLLALLPILAIATAAGLGAYVALAEQPVPLGPCLLIGPRAGKLSAGRGNIGPTAWSMHLLVAPRGRKATLILVHPRGAAAGPSPFRRGSPFLTMIARRVTQWNGFTLVER